MSATALQAGVNKRYRWGRPVGTPLPRPLLLIVLLDFWLE